MYSHLLAGSAARGEPIAVFHGLRQQAEKEVSDDPYLCISDFVAPASSGVRDYLGAFAVGIFGGEAQMDKYAAEHDDYRKIMLQVREGGLTCTESQRRRAYISHCR